MSDENFLGIKTATTVAGFMGAVASLSTHKPLTRFQAIVAVFTGMSTSAYITPAIAFYYQLDAQALISCIAFIIGLIAMYLISGLMRIAEAVSLNPFRFIRLFFKRWDEGEGK